MASPFELWVQDKQKKAKENKLYLPVTKGDSQRKGSKEGSYKWEGNLKHVAGHGRAYNDRFVGAMNDMGVKDPQEIENFRKWLDFKENRSSRHVYMDSSGATKKKEDNFRSQLFSKMNPKPLAKIAKKEPVKLKGKTNSFLQDVTSPLKRFEQAVNPFDKVSFNEALKDNVKDAMTTKRSPITKELNRVGAQVTNSATFNGLENLFQRQGGDPNKDYFNQRQGGGKFADLGYELAGSALPFGMITKGIRGAGLGLKEGSKGAEKILQLQKEGALAGLGYSGAQAGLGYAINPHNQDGKETLKNVVLNTALGGLGDPLLHGLGKLVKPVTDSAITKSINLLGKLRKARGVQDTVQEPIQGLQSQSVEKPSLDRIMNTFKKPNGPVSPIPEMPNLLRDIPKETKISPYEKEFNQAVDSQYNYLKSSLKNRKGVQQGGIIRNELGDVTDRYGRVSENPGWYQEFYKANGKVPNQADLKALAKEQVLNGFNDEVGNIPPWQPKQVQEIDDNINQLAEMIKQDPNQTEPLLPVIQGLEQEKQHIMTSLKTPIKDTVENISPIDNGGSLQRLKPTPKYENISAMKDNGGPLKRVDSIKPNPFDHPFKEGDPLPDTKAHIQSKTKLDKPNLSTLSNKAYIKNVDNLHRLNQFDKEVENALGRQLKPSESSYTLGLNSRGSDMISKQILTQNMVNKNGEAIGQSLKDITMKIPNGKLADFEDYLVNKHAIARMRRGEKVFPDEMNMTTGKSEKIVKQYEQKHPEFKDLSNQYYDYNKQLGQKWLVDTGILSKDQWESYLKANPHYVPNNRIFKDIERPSFTNNAKKGFAGQTNPMKKAIGSQRPIVSPIESTIEHTAQYVKTAKRNEVMQSLINNIKQNPKAFEGWAEIVPTDKTPQSVIDTLQKEGVNGVLENFNKVFEQKPDLTKGNVVTGIINGEKVHVKVHDPQLLEALTNLTPKAQNIVIHSLGQVTRVMKNLTTGINPVFSLTRNIFRDIPTAYSFSKTTNNPVTFSKDLVGAVLSVMKNDELYRSFKAVGGGHASPVSSDVNLLAQSKRSILPQKGIRPLLSKGLGALENLNNAVEAAPRLAEFKRVTKNDNSFDAKMKGLFEANDVTVNFNKFGNVAKEIDSVVPYYNAAIQGIDKFSRVFLSKSSTPAQKAMAGAKAFTAITIPSIALFAVNHDNPNYQKLSNYIKDNNFLFPKKDGTFYKIPKPRELGILFGSDVERTLKSWADSDPKAFKGFAKTVLTNFMPPTRTVLAPFSDIRANKNFANIPIVSGDLKNLSPKYQYDSRTSEISKGLGKLTNTSPKNLDYLIKSYSGVLGELGLPAATKDNGSGVLGRIGQTLKQKVTADPVFSNDIVGNFYDTKTKLDQAHYDLTKQGVQTKNLNEGLRKIFNKKSRQMGDIRKLMKETQNDGSLTSKQRQNEVRKLQEMINKIAESANKQVR